MKLVIISMFAMFSLGACGKGGGGGDIADRAVKAADSICACKEAACARPFMQELNKMAIREEDAVKKLAEARATIYSDAQTRAADCQMKLKQQ